MQTFRKVLAGKLHRATVTDANLEYEGSITIDPNLIEYAGFAPYECVCVWNITNGARFETYVLEGKRGSGEICINGAGAHLAQKGHRVIIANYKYLTEQELESNNPKIVLLHDDNRVKMIK